MGLISRVSSRTYRRNSTKKIKMIRKSLTLLTRNAVISNRSNLRPLLVARTYPSTQISTRSMFSKFSAKSNKGQSEAKQEEKKAEEKEAEVSAELSVKVAELEAAAKKDADIINTLKRGLAEERDAFKRFQKTSEDKVRYSIKPFAKDMLSVHDDLIRAIKFIPAELRQKHEEVEKLVEGIEMTAGNLEKTFKKHHITRIEAGAGVKFDEKIGHEAISILPQGAIPDIEPGQVADEIESGWKLHDRILRSSRVVVVQD